MRCVFSLPNLNVIDNPSFDSYRTTSTTIDPEGYCIGTAHDVTARIHMYMRAPKGLPGLMVFQGEQEIVLPPGLRYTWNKSALSRVEKVFPDVLRYERLDEEWDLKSYLPTRFRAYDVDFIPSPDPARFVGPNIAIRVARLKHGLTLVRKQFQERRGSDLHMRNAPFGIRVLNKNKPILSFSHVRH